MADAGWQTEGRDMIHTHRRRQKRMIAQHGPTKGSQTFVLYCSSGRGLPICENIVGGLFFFLCFSLRAFLYNYAESC